MRQEASTGDTAGRHAFGQPQDDLAAVRSALRDTGTEGGNVAAQYLTALALLHG